MSVWTPETIRELAAAIKALPPVTVNITAERAAELLGVSLETVRRLAKAGELEELLKGAFTRESCRTRGET